MHHKDLEVYKQSIKFVAKIYDISSSFPKEEMYGLTGQLRRAAVSIPSNIAEGCARASSKQILNFVNIAIGSLAEIETQLEIAVVLGFIENSAIFDKEFNQLKSLLLGFKKYISSNIEDE